MGLSLDGPAKPLLILGDRSRWADFLTAATARAELFDVPIPRLVEWKLGIDQDPGYLGPGADFRKNANAKGRVVAHARVDGVGRILDGAIGGDARQTAITFGADEVGNLVNVLPTVTIGGKGD